MTSLTLPIVVGKKYVRRDGTTVTVVRLRGPDERIAVTDAKYPNECRVDTGRGDDSIAPHSLDLVADYIEPAKAPSGEHPYADILRGIADGKTVQWQDSKGAWCDDDSDTVLLNISARDWTAARFRVKPDVIVVNGIDVPAPLRVAPATGTIYYLVDTSDKEGSFRFSWDGGEHDLRCLRLGLVHLTEEAALAHFNALVAPSRLS